MGIVQKLRVRREREKRRILFACAEMVPHLKALLGVAMSSDRFGQLRLNVEQQRVLESSPVCSWLLRGCDNRQGGLLFEISYGCAVPYLSGIIRSRWTEQAHGIIGGQYDGESIADIVFHLIPPPGSPEEFLQLTNNRNKTCRFFEGRDRARLEQRVRGGMASLQYFRMGELCERPLHVQHGAAVRP